MSIKIGNISAKDIYIGSTPVKEIRLGSTLIWSRIVEPEYYTLTINGLDSPGMSCDVKINGIFQDTQSVYTIPANAYVQVLFYTHDGYIVTHESSSGKGEAALGDGWVMTSDETITITTTAIATQTYTLTLNLGEGVDYTDVWYKEPNSDEWIECSKCAEVTAVAGSQFYVEVGLKDGYVLDVTTNLGTEEYPLVLDRDLVMDVVAMSSTYEFDVQFYARTADTEPYSVDSWSVKIGDTVYSGNDEYCSPIITHNGYEPIEVTFEDQYRSYGDYEWSGNILPTYTGGQGVYWDNLSESGTLKIYLN